MDQTSQASQARSCISETQTWNREAQLQNDEAELDSPNLSESSWGYERWVLDPIFFVTLVLSLVSYHLIVFKIKFADRPGISIC